MKLRKLMTLVLFGLLLMNTQCNEDDVAILPCGLEIIIDNSTYNDVESHAIENATITGNCLDISIYDSGCDSNNWVMTLVDSGAIAESMPPQRYLKLSLFNDEACLAVFNKEASFNLIPLRVEGANEVLLHVEGLSEPILYTFN
ncbi:hypothetical protein [Winogradskyella sp. Asnod2-B02-A]|uniref:hypothetical protein n=1 Tax=Winogradskyella sp. Asnod2-B02-A TaxID=3160583 RepID=UPI0038678F24